MEKPLSDPTAAPEASDPPVIVSVPRKRSEKLPVLQFPIAGAPDISMYFCGDRIII